MTAIALQTVAPKRDPNTDPSHAELANAAPRVLPFMDRVWSLLDGSRTTSGVVDAICSEFDVSRDVAERDLEELLTELESVKLIERG